MLSHLAVFKEQFAHLEELPDWFRNTRVSFAVASPFGLDLERWRVDSRSTLVDLLKGSNNLIQLFLCQAVLRCLARVSGVPSYALGARRFDGSFAK